MVIGLDQIMKTQNKMILKLPKLSLKIKEEQQGNTNTTVSVNTGNSNNPVICTKMIGFNMLLLFSRRKNRMLKK